MKTYKITFLLNSPLAFTDTPTFDAILSYAYAREVLGDKFLQKLNYEEKEIIDYSGMPIEQNKGGWFMATKMFWDKKNAVSHVQRWRKRWAAKRDYLTDFQKLKRKVRVNAGEYKSYDMPLTCITTNQVWFYFRSEDIQEVKILLDKWIYFIGKKRSQGYGEIASWDIEGSDYDFPFGCRPIPVEKLEMEEVMQQSEIKIRYCSWKPPYWLPENFEHCVY